MKPIFRTLLLALAALAMTPAVFAGDQVDRAGYKDYPGISRMPGFILREYGDCVETAFDSHKFRVKKDGQNVQQPVEGHMFWYRYRPKQGVTLPSQLQIMHNYKNAALSAGGKVLFEESGFLTLRFNKPGKELWVEVDTNGGGGSVYDLTVIEKGAMKQEVTMDAAAMAAGIKESGKVAIYGIYFDTAKWDLKPNSDQAIGEIAKLLNGDPTLKVFVVGHTDMVGDAAANLGLSQARAQSVIKALVSKHGIAAGRLIAFGNGPYAPVSSNRTDEGRAQNRRVELVEIPAK